MATYLVSYDLRKVRDYSELYQAIKSYGTYAKILESLWAICTTKSAEEVHNHLSGSIDKDDGLFVIKSGVEAAWLHVNCSNEWLKTNL